MKSNGKMFFFNFIQLEKKKNTNFKRLIRPKEIEHRENKQKSNMENNARVVLNFKLS